VAQVSGIVAIWNLDDRPLAADLLVRMRRRLAHRGRDDEGQWVVGPTGLGCQLSRITPESAMEEQPVVGAGGTVLVFDGRVDNRTELLGALRDRADLGGDPADSEIVSAAYDLYGRGLPEKLLGEFAFALFDPRQESLFLARDALGVRPLTYCRIGETVLVASEIKALLEHPAVSATPNADALADFIFDHVHDLEATFFAGVLNLPPAHAALVTRQGVRTWRYWDFDPATRTDLSSFEEYAECFVGLLRAATLRRMRSAHPVSISVSGGLDSSSILSLAAEMSEQGQVARPVAVAYMPPGGSDADESEFLADIEAFTGIQIERLPMAQGILDRCEEGIWHLEVPWLDGQWNTTVEFMGWLGQAGVRVMMTGNWADELLFPQAYLVDLFRRMRWRQISAHLREFGPWMTDADERFFCRRFWMDLVKFHLPGPLLPLAHRSRVKRGVPWFARDFRRHGYRRSWRLRRDVRTSGTAHFRSLYAEARSAHHVMCLEWNDKIAAMHGLEITYPFLDRDLVAFLMSVPGEIITCGGVPKALLREAMRGKLPEAIRQRRWKANFLGAINQGIEWEYDRIVDKLGSLRSAAERGYIDGGRLGSRLVDLRRGLRSDSDEAAAAVLELLALEIWLRVFFEPGERTGADGALRGRLGSR
jgi:asparagine synthase (glutamine-hydrolysing)